MLCLTTFALALFAAQTPQGQDGAFQLRVNEAIDRGAAWLKKLQNADGTWNDGHTDRFKNGVAALGFLTLVKSGAGEHDPSIQKCLHYFDEYKAFDKTYSTGVYMMAIESLKRGVVDKPRLEAAAKWLVEHQDRTSRLWAYPEENPDASNTQYALLGLHAAWRVGVDVPKEVVFATVNAIVKMQQKEGCFSYRDPNDIGIGSMTTAAICALRIAATELKGFPAYEARKTEWEDAEKAAFQWLERHFRVDANPAGFSTKGGMRVWHYYYLYGLERACAMASKSKLGAHSWYREGAEYLLSMQDAAGHWKNDFVDTCFALLFLKRATLTWSPDPKADLGDVVGPPAGEVAWKRPPEPKPDVPFITNWLVCGSFLTKKSEPFGKDEIGETTIKNPKDGDAAGASSKHWKKVSTDQKTLVLDKVLPPFDGAFAYAYANIIVKKDADAILWIGHDDCARAWLNGKLIYENESYGEYANPDAYFARVKLRSGSNAFLVKVYDSGYDCGLVARFSAPDGSRVE
ncbi:MAG: terpene cyclase/mutase family protein [Planctomycetes bacterium]|nr:terpene cyclase/mutase family protein [Planctomycetota bacterium]